MPDPVRQLRRLGGADFRPSPGADRLAREAVQREIARERRPARRRGRRIALVLTPVAIVVLGGAAYFTSRTTPLTNGIACVSEASLRPHETAGVQVDGRPATAICASLWRSGVLGRRKTVPRLQSCRDPEGALAIYVIPAPAAPAPVDGSA